MTFPGRAIQNIWQSKGIRCQRMSMMWNLVVKLFCFQMQILEQNFNTKYSYIKFYPVWTKEVSFECFMKGKNTRLTVEKAKYEQSTNTHCHISTLVFLANKTKNWIWKKILGLPADCTHKILHLKHEF